MTFVSALASIGVTGALTGALGTTAGTIAAGALAGAGTGAALGGVGSALTGGDVGEGMGMGALTGAIGGGVTGGLQSMASPAAQVATTPAMSPVATNTALEQAMGAGANSIPAMSPVATPTALQTATQSAAPSFSEKIGNFAVNNPMLTTGITGLAAGQMLDQLNTPDAAQLPTSNQPKSQFKWEGPSAYKYDPATYSPNVPQWQVYKPQYFADGGITDLDSYAPQMQSAPNAGVLQIPNAVDVNTQKGSSQIATQLLADGGIANLGSYATGGIPNLLQGAGDGVSDDIPATIADKQPARLADGEYIVPSRIVSELGNGSTNAGAQRLDEMVQKIQSGRRKTMGKNKEFAKDTHAYKHLPA